MAIPLATTHLSVMRTVLTANEDAYDANQAAPTLIVSGVRAVIASTTPKMSTVLIGGERGVYTVTFESDVADIQLGDEVTDDNGQQYEVLDVSRQTGLGFDYLLGELRKVTGVVCCSSK